MSGEPYLGLRPYDIGDKDRFYGRSRECRDVSALWQSNRLLVVYGPSGVGKTSLVQAGVIPQFDEGNAVVLPVARLSHGSGFHMADLPERNPYDFALLSAWLPEDLPASLVGLSLKEFLSRRAQTDRYGDPLPVLAVIDQFEELFSDFPQRRHYLEEFIDHLADALTVPSLRLLISIRDEALADLIPRETTLAGHSRARFRVLPLTSKVALEAVTGPLVGTGRSFAPGVAEKLVDDLRTVHISSHGSIAKKVVMESVEPVQVQVACTALWRALPEDVTIITEEYLHQTSDVRTVAEVCARMVAEVAAEHQTSERKLHEWLERAFITRLGSRGKAYEGISETYGMPNEIAASLEKMRILESGQRSGLRWYQLQHDRLIEPIRQANRPSFAEAVSEKGPAHDRRTAESALADGQLELAKMLAEEALAKCDDDDLRTRAEVESFLGMVTFQSGDFAQAQERYMQAAEHFEAAGDKAAVGRVLAARGRVLLTRRPYADAVDALQAAVARLPDDVAVQVEFARALWYSGDLRGAAAVAGGVLNLRPDATEALAGRGQILVELGEYVAALEDLNNLPKLQSEDAGRRPEVRAARALALAGLGRLEEATIEADGAVEDAPQDGRVLLRAAGVAHAVGMPSRELLLRARAAQRPPLLPHQRKEADRLARTA